MAGSFFGFEKLKSQGIPVRLKPDADTSLENDITLFEEVKKEYANYWYLYGKHLTNSKCLFVCFSAKCISLLGLILISTWLLEIVTFYSPGPQIYLILMDMVNGLQGVFVLLIFLIVRRRRNTIFRWWNDRGSYIVEKIELDSLN